MLKRGQVTIFLVIGIVILLLSAGFFFIFSKMKKAPLEVELEESQKYLGVPGAVQSFVEKCIKDTIDPAIYLLASQGGIIYPEKDNLVLLTDYGLVNYAWMNGISGLSKQKMEQDLAKYLEDNIDFCLAGFETFEKQNILVEADYEKSNAQVTIQESIIRTEFDFPLQVVLSNSDTQALDTFRVQQQSNLGTMIETIAALQFPDLQPQDFRELSYQPMVFPFDQSVTIYSLSRNEVHEPLNFLFAVRNDFPENEAPQLAFLPDKTFRKGDRWQEELLADDPNRDILFYSSDSNQFSISDQGTIDVEMNSPGIFEVTFTVEDNRGGKDQQEVSILVLE